MCQVDSVNSAQVLVHVVAEIANYPKDFNACSFCQ